MKIYPDDDYTSVYSPARYKQSEQASLPLVELSSTLLALFPPLSFAGLSSATFNPVQYDCKVQFDIEPWNQVKISLETGILDSFCSPDFIRAYLDGLAFSSESAISVPFKSGPATPLKMSCEGKEGQKIGFINGSTSVTLELPELGSAPENAYPIADSEYMSDKALDLEYLLRQRRNFPVHAILIHGPSGCGKTHLVEQVSHRLGFKLVHIAAHDILDMPSNDPFEAILKIHAQQPSNEEKNMTSKSKVSDIVLFLDDVDVLLTNDEISDLESQRKVQIHFEALVDSIRQHSANSDQRIIVICASNNPNAINASTRNLFEREIPISLPSPALRLSFLKRLLTPMTGDDLLQSLPLEELSTTCHGYSLADLENLVRVASTACQLRQKRQRDTKLREGEILERQYEKSDSNSEDLSSASKILSMLHLDGHSPSMIGMNMEDLWCAKRETTAESMKSDSHLIPSSVKRVDASQLGGLETQYDQLLQSTVWIYQYAEKLEKMGVSPPRGVLLFGPPGTGKTMLAKCVANASNANFLSISISDLIRGEIGGTEQEISKIFKIARSISPCIIFLDEIQSLFGSRDSSGSHGKNMISQLLLEMDGLTNEQEVVVIGATNRPDWIDPALLRPGRFERCLYIPPPSESARIHILETNLRKFRIDPSSINESFIKGIAKRCERFSGADLANLCLKAAWKVVRGDSTSLKPKFGALPSNSGLSKSHHFGGGGPTESTNALRNTMVADHLLSAFAEFSPTITQDMIALYEAFTTKYGRSERQQMAQGDSFAKPEDLQKAADRESLLLQSHLEARERYRKERLAQMAKRDSKR
jgi:transitional endoplasmic reticulum ATPase